jgi:hypothetical protein
MRWQSLPPELLGHVLLHLSLPQLRLVKAVSRATANTCRRVVRSYEWTDDTRFNCFYMNEEMKTQFSSYKLPMTVSLFDEHFDDWHKCIATVHKLKLGRMKAFGELLNAHDREVWSPRSLNDDSTDTIILEMCIEIHGRGIAGSERALRRMLQQALREHGNDDDAHDTSDEVNTILEVRDQNGDACIVARPEGDKMSLTTLLQNICPATQLRKGKWTVHRAPFSQVWNSCDMNVLHMCAMGLNLFL